MSLADIRPSVAAGRVFRSAAVAVCWGIICAGGLGTARAEDRPAPEIDSGRTDPAATVAERHIMATANPLASEAGLAILREGGGAIDAVIAAQMVLNLVEPQASGIGGGALLLVQPAGGGEPLAYDGRETAPAAATPDMFLDADGSKKPFAEARLGGGSVGTPGLLRVLALAHRAHGRLPWARLFEPAIALAEDGFAISPRLARQIAGSPDIPRFPILAAYLLDVDGTPLPAGTWLRNPVFADTLRRIAAGGPDAFYRGPIAADIAAAVAARGGRLTEGDLAGYEAKPRRPVCGPYRLYRVCAMPPPSSGGIALLQMLALLERFDLATPGPTVQGWHLLAEAGRLAFADRDRYVADTDFVPVPVEGLTDRAYLAARSRAIDPARDMGPAQAGEPPGRRAGLDWAPSTAEPLPSTSHIEAVDDAGTVVAMTTTIESAFGSHVMVRGFVLNNELTDFDFEPARDGRPVANRVEPGKRPRSSMVPTIVYGPDAAPVLSLGSAGGSQIIGYVAKTVVAVLDWGYDIQAAIALPNLTNRNGPTEIEDGTALTALAPALQAMGHTVRATAMTSGTQGIQRTPRGWLGGVDPRREGAARGD